MSSAWYAPGPTPLAIGKYTNPAGFYIHLVLENTPIPEGFKTNAQRKAREDKERRHEEERRAQQELETEYDWYCDGEIDRFVAALDPVELAAVMEAKRQEDREKYTYASPDTIDRFARHEIRHELRKRVPLMTLEEFKANREQGPVSFPQLIPEPLAGDAAPGDLASATPVDEEAAIDQLPPNGAADSPPPHIERGDAVQSAPEPATNPAISEPAIELVSEPPQLEPDGESIGGPALF